MILGGPRLNTVFANRWRAIWFALTVLATAYCTVPSPEETARQEKAEAAKAEAAKPWWAADED